MLYSKPNIMLLLPILLIYAQLSMGNTTPSNERSTTAMTTTLFSASSRHQNRVNCSAAGQVLSGFVCSPINNPNNHTIIIWGSSEFEAIKESLNSYPLTTDNSTVIPPPEKDPSYDKWITAASIWVWEGIEMAVLIGGSLSAVKVMVGDRQSAEKKEKRNILSTAFLTSTVTMVAIYGTGSITVAVLGQELPEKWIELIEGLTKLKASICVAGWAIGVAKGAEGKTKPAMSGILINVAANTFRETAEGALVTLPLILDGQYYAIILSFIPYVILAVLTKDFKFLNNPSSFMKLVGWGITATLASGLLSSAFHEFEEVAGETPEVWDIGKDVTLGDDYKILSHKNLPMAIIAPFGYRPNPTVMTVVTGAGMFLTIFTASAYFKYRTKQRWGLPGTQGQVNQGIEIQPLD